MVSLSDIERDDPNFRSDLRESHVHVKFAAEWLTGLGYTVEVKPLRERPSIEQMHDYADDGDLEVMVRGRAVRVEVKKRSIGFGPSGGFPYSTVIVDVAHTWDNAGAKPYAYIILNDNSSACLIVYGTTFDSWSRVRRFDTKKLRHRTFYECPVRLCRFMATGR